MTIFLDQNQKPVRKPRNKKISWRISAYAVIRRGKSLLMVKPQWNILWELPGGGIEINEDITKGIERECLEETGYQVKVSSDLPLYLNESNFYSNLHKKFFHSVIVIYTAKLSNLQQINNLINKAEISEIQWTLLERLNKKDCHPIIWPVIRKLKQH